MIREDERDRKRAATAQAEPQLGAQPPKDGIGGNAPEPRPEGERSLFDLAEEFLKKPEHQIGIAEHLSDKAGPLCGGNVTNPACERCRAVIVMGAFARAIGANEPQAEVEKAQRELAKLRQVLSRFCAATGPMDEFDTYDTAIERIAKLRQERDALKDSLVKMDADWQADADTLVKIAEAHDVLEKRIEELEAQNRCLMYAARKIAVNYGGCHCDHTDDSCCEHPSVGEFCPHCISEIALAEASRLLTKEGDDAKIIPQKR